MTSSFATLYPMEPKRLYVCIFTFVLLNNVCWISLFWFTPHYHRWTRWCPCIMTRMFTGTSVRLTVLCNNLLIRIAIPTCSQFWLALFMMMVMMTTTLTAVARVSMGMIMFSFGTLTMMNSFVFHVAWSFVGVPDTTVFVRVAIPNNIVFIIEMICDVKLSLCKASLPPNLNQAFMVPGVCSEHAHCQ